MLQSFYSRLSPRCGRKRALVALGHRLLRVIYHILLRDQPLPGIECPPIFQPEERPNFRNNGSLVLGIAS